MAVKGVSLYSAPEIRFDSIPDRKLASLPTFGLTELAIECAATGRTATCQGSMNTWYVDAGNAH